MVAVILALHIAPVTIRTSFLGLKIRALRHTLHLFHVIITIISSYLHNEQKPVSISDWKFVYLLRSSQPTLCIIQRHFPL